MQAYQVLIQRLRKSNQKFTFHVDNPYSKTGIYWIDIWSSADRRTAARITFMWQIWRGFGFYSGDSGYGEKPEEFVTDIEKALKKVQASLR